VAEIAGQFGRLDGLAVTAGTLQTRKTLLDVTDEDWDAYFQVHLMMTVWACRAVIPHLIAQGGGIIVNTAAYSIRAQKPPLLGYATMKSAIASLTKNIALTYGAQGVRANTVCPGFVASEGAHRAMRAAAARRHRGPPAEGGDGCRSYRPGRAGRPCSPSSRARRSRAPERGPGCRPKDSRCPGRPARPVGRRRRRRF
jgi:NAD(P)-dependent dehydrogenase (short-subunit alcohol dehydrogenase family)